MAQIGDTVRYLNSVGGGKIIRIEGNMAYVDEDGFETPVLLRECVVVAAASAAPKPEPKHTAVAPKVTTTSTPSAPAPIATEITQEDIAETPEGEQLNVVLAYEPREIKHINTTEFDAYLVNDSNYYLYFTYMTRADADQGWTTRYAGIVEPNIQVWLGEVLRSDIPQMERVAVQIIAFKRDKEFTLKNPIAVETPLDNTKFFKLHCFHDNIYFDTPVIAVDIVKNDIPVKRLSIDSARIEDAIKAKKAVDRQHRKPVQKRKKASRINGDVIEVDLHIHELIDNTRGLSNADMLNLQIDEFRRVMDENLRNKGQKIVFIHGKGEGILRQALLNE
ncbi:MAG: DUF2027 domain-containing protein, partial [Paramuribaculum sp.]|nr:DUF2027 domain-containing protein [Paramuribaculum sp.]